MGKQISMSLLTIDLPQQIIIVSSNKVLFVNLTNNFRLHRATFPKKKTNETEMTLNFDYIVSVFDFN